MNEERLHESRFWVIARRPPCRKALPYAWSSWFSVAVLLARCVRRCGLESVRVIDVQELGRGPRVVWPLEGDGDTLPG